MIGPYKLLQEIGAGGMGTVWMAEQTEPVQRKVALKIIKPGMDSRQVIARFEAERQALALMDHPNIARVLDAGTTETCRPYFVMELVKGVPITKYCDLHHLMPKQRLELFVPVCQAVQHAHQKGIIHRDLKPSNVLVAEYDDKPVAKVIDFGVAKATGPKLTDRTIFTELGQVVGTLEYMSPEQAKLNALDIDTRSDIYALGVLLYELLTGTTPFERKRLKQAAFDEILRIIREEEPPKPSTRLSTTEELPSIAANRGLEPRKLSGLVRGELDWIVMKCLEKDRNRRYETANGLARDIEHYLHDEPVNACPPSRRYRLRKFARKNRKLLMVVGAFALLMLAGAGVSTWQAVRATRAQQVADRQRQVADQQRQVADQQRQRAQGNLQLALKALDNIYLQVAEERLPRDPQRKKEDTELLKKALEFYQRFAQQNSSDTPARLEVSRAQRRAGDIQRFVGDYAAARQAYITAVARAQDLGAEFPGESQYSYELAVCHNALAEELMETGEGRAAADQFRQAIELLTKLTAEYSAAPQYRAELARSHHNLGRLHNQQGERSAANISFQQALDIQSKLSAEFPSTPQYRADLAEMHRYRGGWIEFGWPSYATEDIGHIRLASEILSKLVADFPGVPLYRARLAATLRHLGDFPGNWKERIDCYHQAIDIMTKLVAEFPQVPDYRDRLGACYGNLSVNYLVMGDLKERARYAGKAVELYSELTAKYPSVTQYKINLAVSQGDMAGALVSQGQLAEARTFLKDAIAQGEAIHKSRPDNPRYASMIVPFKHELASVHAALRQSAEEIKCRTEADIIFGETWERLRTTRASSKAAQFCADAGRELQEFAKAWTSTGNYKAVTSTYEAAIRAYDQAIALDSTNADVYFRRGELNARLSKYEEAAADFSRVIELDPKGPDAWYNDPNDAMLLRERAGAYMKLRRYDRALRDYSRIIELHPNKAWAWRVRGSAYVRMNQHDKALADLTKAVGLEPQSVMLNNELAWFLATCPDVKLRDAAKAVTAAKRAVELAPKSRDCWNTLGAAYYRAENWQEAVAALQKSMDLSKGGDSFDFILLAMTYGQMGRKDEARKWYDKAVQRMDKNQPKNEELLRFRAEAALLLGIKVVKK
jgi:serine/threonine protein kinase/tetratricopeptide (TPR) repeat protein